MPTARRPSQSVTGPCNRLEGRRARPSFDANVVEMTPVRTHDDSAQLELEAVQIRVKAASAAVNDSSQYLDKLPDYLKDVEKALVPLRK